MRPRKREKTHSYNAHKTKLGKVWHFLWHDDSLFSFVVDIILILIIGKFLLYPGIGALMGTSFPIVAVISGSMDHQNLEFEEWWDKNGEWYEQNDISKEAFDSYKFSNGFKKGDVLFIVGRQVSELELGDVIVYSVSARREPIIHRVVGLSGEVLTVTTKGDANSAQLLFEISITDPQIHGKAVMLIPKIGWIKVLFVELLVALR